MSFSGNISLDNINSILSIKNEDEMSKKISYNIPKISKIFESFEYKISYNQQINQNDTKQIMDALKFVDNLNLFMEESDVKKFKEQMEYIKDNLNKRNWEFKETIKGQIKYTEMTIINHRKNYYKNMYFNSSNDLSEEIEKELEQVNKTNKFDFKLFKQLQNIFWVVKNVIDDKKKQELENKLNSMKILSKRIKEKYKYDSNTRGGYSMYEDYEYTDYKNYTGNYDYNDNFYNRNDNYYNNKQMKYDDSYYDNKYYHGRGSHRKGGFTSSMGNSNRLFYIKKQKEEKEVEIPSDPSYYIKNKEEDLKEENKDNNLYNDNNINNINMSENNNNINGGNDINNRENINVNNNMNNDMNDSNYNGGIKEESNSSLDQRINMENNGGNGDNSNINSINVNENNSDNVEIITNNTNLTQNNSGNYNRKPKKIIIQNKMIAVEVPSSSGAVENKENNIVQNSNQNNINNIRDINDESNNNGARIESNINNIENNNNEFNINNNINSNNNINEHNGDDNIETRQYNNNNNFIKNHKYPYYNNYNNNGYKQNNYNKNYYNNYYNRHGIQINSNMNNSNKKYSRKSPNKKIDFVEIDENNNIIQNNNEINNQNINQNEANELVNGQENENNSNNTNTNNNNMNNNKTNESNNINIDQEQNEPNGEVINEDNNQNKNEINFNNNNNNNNNDNLEINKNESNDLNAINNNLELNQQENENFAQMNQNIINENDANQINGEDKNQSQSQNQNVISENNIVNEDIKETKNDMEPNQEEDNKEQVDLVENNNNIENENIDNENNSNKDNNKYMENYVENDNYGIDELDEENNDNLDSHEHSEEDEQDNIKYQGDFNKFCIENIGIEPKGFKMVKGNSDEKDDNNDDNGGDCDADDLDEMINDDIENENLMGMSLEEKEIELKISMLIKNMNIHQMILDAESELEQEDMEEQLNKEKNETSNEAAKASEPKDNETNKENNDNNTQNHSNKYIDTVKEIDPQLRNKIKDQLKNNFKLQEILAPKYTFYKNEFFIENSQMFSNDLLSCIQKYKTNQNVNTNFTMDQFIIYSFMRYPNKDNEIFRNYLFYKCKLIEKPEEIWSNMQNFEKRILLPLYQKLIDPRNKRYNSLEIIFKLYYKAIYNSIPNSKEVIDKVKSYGSFQNTFMVDIGDTDIDICIVPKISLSEFNSDYLEKLKQGIISSKLGEIKAVINNNSYILLKIKYSYLSKQSGKKIEVNVDISVHNMLPIFNTHLIRLYGLFDQRFHIMGIYLKYWAKTNNIHGAMDGYLSSYALLIMMIHFLQKIVEPKVLPNLQKIPVNNNYSNPVYGEEIYKYDYFGKTIETNSYYETDVERIKEYMIKVNEGKVNQETVTNLLVKFFEYYAYFYDSKQKISVHKDLVDSIKDHDDNIAFSIEDPFEITHNPGRSMSKNTDCYNKFIKAMKREVNFILGGEYVKRLEIEQNIRLANLNSKN